MHIVYARSTTHESLKASSDRPRCSTGPRSPPAWPRHYARRTSPRRPRRYLHRTDGTPEAYSCRDRFELVGDRGVELTDRAVFGRRSQQCLDRKVLRVFRRLDLHEDVVEERLGQRLQPDLEPFVHVRYDIGKATSFPDSSAGPLLASLRTLHHRDVDEGLSPRTPRERSTTTGRCRSTKGSGDCRAYRCPDRTLNITRQSPAQDDTLANSCCAGHKELNRTLSECHAGLRQSEPMISSSLLAAGTFTYGVSLAPSTRGLEGDRWGEHQAAAQSWRRASRGSCYGGQCRYALPRLR
jgi:hypothetical protein